MCKWFPPVSHGDVSECSSCGSLEGLDGHQGNNSKQRVRWTYTSIGMPECRPHPPVTWCSSSPLTKRGQRLEDTDLLLRHWPPGQPGGCSPEDIALMGGMGQPASPSLRGRSGGRVDGRHPPSYSGTLRGTSPHLPSNFPCTNLGVWPKQNP